MAALLPFDERYLLLSFAMNNETVSIRRGPPTPYAQKVADEFSPFRHTKKAHNQKVSLLFFDSLIRSVEVLEKIKNRWRFLLTIEHETWAELVLDVQTQSHLVDDLQIMIAIKESLPFDFDNDLPSLHELPSQESKLHALVAYLASLSSSLTKILGMYDEPKKTLWQKIKSWFCPF
jgi:hypothetical protein